jgi:FkbM family methyltransferase
MIKNAFLFLIRLTGLVRRRGHTFFPELLVPGCRICDCGSHRGEFISELTTDGMIKFAVAVEANPFLAQTIMARKLNSVEVVNAALVAQGVNGTVMLNLSGNLEASSVFSEVAEVYGRLDAVQVPSINLKDVIGRFESGKVELVKMDIEGAEIEVLSSAPDWLLANVTQITTEFHDNFYPAMKVGVDQVVAILQRSGFRSIKASWPYNDDILFVNVATLPGLNFGLHLRITFAKFLYVVRGCIFWTIRKSKGEI